MLILLINYDNIIYINLWNHEFDNFMILTKSIKVSDITINFAT